MHVEGSQPPAPTSWGLRPPKPPNRRHPAFTWGHSGPGRDLGRGTWALAPWDWPTPSHSGPTHSQQSGLKQIHHNRCNWQKTKTQKLKDAKNKLSLLPTPGQYPTPHPKGPNGSPNAPPCANVYIHISE